MKNPNQERLRRLMGQYHRSHPWRLDNGLFIPHAYPVRHKLSWWDDVGFVLNGRRVMVWWIHPRRKYADTVEDMAWEEAGEPPFAGADIFGPAEKQWKRVGRSRKEVVAYRSAPTPDAQRDFYAKLRQIETRLKSDGVDLVARPSMTVKAYSWCIGIDLCIPLEVRNKEEVVALAALARRLIKRETTIAKEFPGYQYGKVDWLAEADLRSEDRQADKSHHEAEAALIVS